MFMNTSSHNPLKKVEAVLDRWLNLQKLIKEEITLNEIIYKQQQNSIDILKNYYYEYYKIKLKIRETFENVISIGTNKLDLSYFDLSLEGERLLGDAFDPIQKLLFLLRNDFQIVLKIISLIDEGDFAKKNNISMLVDLFCHQFYENLLIPNPEHEELLILCYLLLEKEIDNMNSASVSSFLEESSTFLGKFLRSYTKKQELKTYLTMTLGSLIIKIENSAESFLDLNPCRISNHLKEKKSAQIQDKSYMHEKTRELFGVDNDILTRKISKSKVIKRRSSTYNTDKMITYTLKEGILVNAEVSRSANKNDNITKLIENTNFNSKITNSEFYFEIVDGIDSLKYEDNDDFNVDYSIELTQEELKGRIMREKDENLREFYLRQLERINRDPDIFTNKKFIQSFREINNPQEVMRKYKENFLVIKEFIDTIIKTLIDNISTIPYTLRCICRIIDTLICRKFPHINKYERNSFIGEFIFGKCILPILINSDINAIITSTILSLNTRQCLKMIAKVLTKINRGIFFETNIDTDFTIFNHYIIEVIPEINKFYEDLIDVTLPRVLEDLINGVIMGKDIVKYDYFKENVDELVNIQCICFSVKDVLLLVKLIKPKLHQFRNIPSSNLFIKSIEKISNQENYLNQLINKNPLRNFFLIYKEEFNLLKTSKTNSKVFQFSFNNEIENNDVVFKRIKFCVKLILRGLNLINNKVYSHLNQAFTTQNFFVALNQILQLEEFTETEFNDRIPLNWYSLYMMSNLQFLSEEIKQNDYEKLYCDLLYEENKEIELLKEKSNLIITKYGLNTRCVEKIIEKIKRDLGKVKQIDKFMKMEKFINKAIIEVCVRCNSREDENEDTKNTSLFGGLFFWSKRRTVNEPAKYTKDYDDTESCTILIKESNKCIHKRLQYLEKLTEGKPEKKSSKGNYKSESKIDGHAETIREFIKIFGKLNEIKEDIVKGDQRHKIYQSLYNYMQIVRETLVKDDLFQKSNEEEIEEILDGIENYIMKKIYKLVYPREKLEKDVEFFNRTCQLSWITPFNLEINKAYLNENLWVLAINCVNKMDEEKSPYDKLKCVSSAHKIINNCIKFCSGKDENAGADDLSPIFQYIILKAKPKRIFSNINFIKSLVHPKKLQGFMGLLLCQIESAAEFIFKEVDHEKLKMTKEQFDKMMNPLREDTFKFK